MFVLSIIDTDWEAEPSEQNYKRLEPNLQHKFLDTGCLKHKKYIQECAGASLQAVGMSRGDQTG
jgi:hypothetical protein